MGWYFPLFAPSAKRSIGMTWMCVSDGPPSNWCARRVTATFIPVGCLPSPARKVALCPTPSPGWAMGLMQLMPATAKETANASVFRCIAALAYRPRSIFNWARPTWSQIYGQFNGNRVLASAAYNAGPGRVRQWLRGADHLSYDVWIENIPF